MGKLRKVLVPILKKNLSAHAIELACRVGHDECAELVLVHVVVVPYTLSLDEPLPEQDRDAKEEFDLASTIAARYGCPARVRIVHQRYPADGVLQIAREEKVDAIVLGVGAEERVPGEWEHTITEVLHRAECEVIIDRVPLAAQAKPQQAANATAPR